MKKIRVFPQDGINSPCYIEATATPQNKNPPLFFFLASKNLIPSKPNSHTNRNSDYRGGNPDTG
jgi:hypothetical protein